MEIVARLVRLEKLLGALYEGLAEAAAAKAKMQAATEAFMLMVVGWEVGDVNQKIQGMCGGMSGENMRQTPKAKENEESLKVEETVGGSMMSAETDGCGFHSLLYLLGPTWWFRMSVFLECCQSRHS